MRPRIPFIRQPPPGTPIASEFRLGLLASFNGTTTPEYHRFTSGAQKLLHVGRGPTTADGSDYYKSGNAYGINFTTGAVIRGYTDSANPDQLVSIPAGSWTFQCRVDNVNFNGSNPGFWRNTSTQSGTTFAIQNAATLRPWVRVNGVDILKPASGPQWATGQTLDIIYRFVNAKSVDVWFNGKQQHSATHSTSAVALEGANAIYAIGSQSITEYVTGYYSAIRFWSRALPDDLMQRLAVNPWDFYEPTRRRFFSVSTGVANTLTLSASQTQTASPVRSVAATRSASDVCSAAITRAMGAARSAQQTTSALLTRSSGHACSASTAETAATVRSAGRTVSATQADSATVSTRSLLARALSATQACTASVARSIAKTFSASTAETAVLLAGQLLTKALSAIQTTSATLKRSVGAGRSAAQACTAAASRVMSASRVATQAQVASVARGVSKGLAATQACTAAVQRAAARVLTLAATQASTAALTRAIAATRLAVQAGTAAIAKSVNTTLGALQTQTASFFAVGGRAIGRACVAAIKMGQAAVRAVLRGLGRVSGAPLGTAEVSAKRFDCDGDC